MNMSMKQNKIKLPKSLKQMQQKVVQANLNTQRVARRVRRNRRRINALAAAQNSPIVAGDGNYISDLANYAPSALSTIGGAFGPLAGAGGNLVGQVIKKIFGSGDYDVKSNSLMPLYMGNELPGFGNLSKGTRVAHREFIANIVEPASNSGAFTLANYRINAGLAQTFPWLSTLAANYQQYKIHGMVAEFKTNSSDVTISGTSIGLGTVIMATDYDSADQNYASKVQMLQSQYSTSGKPSLTMIHPFECAPDATGLKVAYTRSQAVPSGTDIRMYDLGNFQIATSGIPNSASAQTLGELWLSYDIELLKPELEGGVVGNTNISWKWQCDIKTTTTGTYFGTPPPTLLAGSSASQPTISGNAINFPINTQGNFLFLYSVVGASTALTNALAIATSTNFTALNLWDQSSLPNIHQPAGTTSTNQFFWATYSIIPSVTGNQLSITGGTLPGSVAGVDLWIIQINPGITN